MSPDATSYTKRFRFIIFTCRDPANDFRSPLVRALRQRGEAWSVWLRRRPLISGPTDADATREVGLDGLIRFVRGLPRDDCVNVYLNSTNTYFPGFSAILRSIAPPGIWCLDMHDDLRYHNLGLKRWREAMIISSLCLQSHVVVRAAEALRDLFPTSHHLGNASHIRPLDLSGASWDDILVIASFDQRFDFAFLCGVAALAPELRFHLHGWASHDDPVIRARLGHLPVEHPNIRYHGAYTVDDLPAILRRHHISLAPYRANSGLTRYIDPLRFYHCLNAGLEVVSTAIPQADSMRESLHVVTDPAACVRALAAIRAGTSRKQALYEPVTWEQRADRLIEIIEASPRMRTLA